MKFTPNEFRLERASPIESALDFDTLRSLLAAHQAALPTARLAAGSGDARDHAHPVITVLTAGPGRRGGAGLQGSFHPAAAACVAARSR